MAYDRQLLALKNRRNVIDIIRERSPINKAEIAKLTGLSIPTVMKITDSLERQRLICSIGRGESTGGKPPEMLEFIADALYIIGVDIGRCSVKVIIMDMGAQIYHRKEMSTEGTEDVNGFLLQIVELVNALIAETKIDTRKILGIGVGMPGILKTQEGKVIFSPNFMWQNVELLRIFKERFSCPILMENSNRTMAIGEHWYGASHGMDQVLNVNLGYGIGAAMLEGRHVKRGNSESSGELGHMILKKDGDICSCGHRGCLESISSGYAIARRARQEIVAGRGQKILEEASGQLEKVEAKHVFLAAQVGDLIAQEIIKEAVEYLGIGIANCINLIDPQMVVITGGIMKSSDYFFEDLKREIRKNQMRYCAVDVDIRKGKLGEDATAIGAAVLPLRRFINRGASVQAFTDL